jgi:hypothetical protein
VNEGFAVHGRRPLSLAPPRVQVGAERLIARLEAAHPRGFTATELGENSGLRPQQVSVVLTALAVLGRVTAIYASDRRAYVWSSTRTDTTRRSSKDHWYTIKEAARITGRTEKALRRRVERGTLRVQRHGSRVEVSHRALAAAGLIEGRPRPTSRAQGIRLIVYYLRRPPRRGASAWQLSSTGRLPRQTTEVALATLAAAGVVKRELAWGVAWRWVG